MKNLSLVAGVALALSLIAGGDAMAKQCRDAKGKFAKCTAPGAIPVRPKG